jgi:hypothetical protein
VGEVFLIDRCRLLGQLLFSTFNPQLPLAVIFIVTAAESLSEVLGRLLPAAGGGSPIISGQL